MTGLSSAGGFLDQCRVMLTAHMSTISYHLTQATKLALLGFLIRHWPDEQEHPASSPAFIGLWRAGVLIQNSPVGWCCLGVCVCVCVCVWVGGMPPSAPCTVVTCRPEGLHKVIPHQSPDPCPTPPHRWLRFATINWQPADWVMLTKENKDHEE